MSVSAASLVRVLLVRAWSLLIRSARAYESISSSHTWLDAQQQCLTRYNTSLATIRNSEQNTRATQLCSALSSTDKCWIGANDLSNKNGTFYFVNQFNEFDAVAVNYTKWARGEPNYDYSREHCVELYSEEWTSWANASSTWNDQQCNRTNAAICNSNSYTTSNETTKQPSGGPSVSPTWLPSHVPTHTPSGGPSNTPSRGPSPSASPTWLPSSHVSSYVPSYIPSVETSYTPTYAPSYSPSAWPSRGPSVGGSSGTASGLTGDQLQLLYVLPSVAGGALVLLLLLVVAYLCYSNRRKDRLIQQLTLQGAISASAAASISASNVLGTDNVPVLAMCAAAVVGVGEMDVEIESTDSRSAEELFVVQVPSAGRATTGTLR